MKILIIDNFDSFTYNLVDYIRQAGADVEVKRNNIDITTEEINLFDAMVLSPGPETPVKAGNLMKIINDFYLQIPILGVCLGHQALGTYFGAKLEKAKFPMHGKISEINLLPHPIFKNLGAKTNVVRYHSLILNGLPDSLAPIAFTSENEIMAFSHKALPIIGLQFHPEAALTEGGMQMINDWINNL